MASLKAAMKGHQKAHRERGQLSNRKHLGLLEKRKDYILRAKSFHRKEEALKRLRKKASEKNPDEFYFQMVSSKTKDGVHIKPKDHEVYTKVQIDLMKTQDLNYLNLQKNREAKKIERLKDNLHFLDEADKHTRSHTFFVDSKREENDFDAAVHCDSLPNLNSHTDNKPTNDILQKSNCIPISVQKKFTKLRQKSYNELQSRIDRDNNLKKARDGLILQQQLQGKGTVHKKIVDGKVSYRWKKIRKR